jgi:hypothetical protein
MLCLLAVFINGNIQSKTSTKESKMDSPSLLLIDDFSNGDGVSSMGPEWRQFTDRVMGGVSTGMHSFDVIEGQSCIHLQGRVSLENNGGFIQVALPLDLDGRPFNASQFTGLSLWVRGNSETYFVHLRTSQTQLPWQYYQAQFFADAQWREVKIPFTRFKPENLSSKIDPKKLKRLAVVAAKQAYQADVAVSRIEFYR